MKKVKLVVAFLIIFSTFGIAQPDVKKINLFYGKYVSKEGFIDYKSLKKSVKNINESYNILVQSPPLETWFRNEKIAYWINVYNLSILKMILNDYPVKSILDIKDGGIWKEKSIAIGTKQYSLDDIQHTILVKELNEPRVHFVLFSGAISSPKLHNEAFTAANLNVNLEKLTKGFVNSQQNTFSKELTEVSMIFKWYETDFGNLVTFINKYAKKKLKFGTEITFSDYNWDLFEPKIIYYP